MQEAVKERILGAKDQLSDPNSDSNRDRFLKGMIWAFNEVLDMEPNLMDEEFVNEIQGGDTST